MQNKTSDTIEKINFFNIIHNTRLDNEIYDVNCSMSDYQNTPHNQTSHLYTNLTNVFYSAIPNSKEIGISSVIMASANMCFEGTMTMLGGTQGGAFGKMIVRDSIKTVPIVINVISDTKVQHTDFHYDGSNIFSSTLKIACKSLIIGGGAIRGGTDISATAATSNFICEVPATFIRRLGEHKQGSYNTTDWQPYLFEMWKENKEELLEMGIASTAGSVAKMGTVFLVDKLLVGVGLSAFFMQKIASAQMSLSGAPNGGTGNGVSHIRASEDGLKAHAYVAMFLAASFLMYFAKEIVYSTILMTLSSIAQRVTEEFAYRAKDYILDPIASHVLSPIANYTSDLIGNYVLSPIGNYVLSPIGNYVLSPIGNYVLSPIGNYVLSPIANYTLGLIGNYVLNPIANYFSKHDDITTHDEGKKEHYFPLPKLNETDINLDDPLGIDHHNFNNESHYNILFDAQ